MKPVRDMKKEILKQIEENPKKPLLILARELGIPEKSILEVQPAEQVSWADPEDFERIMEHVSSWGPVTIICQNDSVVLEVKAHLPSGSHGHGYFNLFSKESPAGGHIKSSHLGAICFVERPFMGIPSLSIQFFDLFGNSMFKIYVARDEKRQLVPEQVERFYMLRRNITLRGRHNHE